MHPSYRAAPRKITLFLVVAATAVQLVIEELKNTAALLIEEINADSDRAMRADKLAQLVRRLGRRASEA